ncbi:glycosyltransferase [Sphingomonas sp. LY29]|uniref:glycosyltransferase n=1 Tax=Sphingomonas sp. LY29 TaxID=3095341 RepID=UPI002D7A3CB5|nr:glycosyltransferase [Sphingomonas sp. LY29]WRP26343.1 glycosyltransferase [Sphingomonas sp. LY29]
MANVLILSKYYHPFRGGIEDNVTAVATTMATCHKVTVLSFHHERGKPTESELIEGVSVRRARTPFVVKSQPLSLRYVWEVLWTRADLIYFHSPNVLGSAALAVRALFDRRTQLVTMHHMDIYGRKMLRWIARHLIDRILQRSSRLIVTSFKNADVSNDIRVPVPTVAIPLGIRPELFVLTRSDRDAAADWRRELCGDASVVLFLGRLARYKGLEVLVRAMAALPEAVLLVAGQGPLRDSIEKQVTELGLGSRVRFLGPVNHRDKLRLLALADVFAFPSTEITEAFGMSQVEAMLIGVPVVASDLPTGVTDVAIHRQTALLVPPGDSQALAIAMRQILTDKPLGRELAERARRHVLANFTIDCMASRNLSLVDDVLSQRSP